MEYRRLYLRRYAGQRPAGFRDAERRIGWNNSETRTVSDLTINKNSPGGKVGYVFDVNNRPHTSSGKKYTSVPVDRIERLYDPPVVDMVRAFDRGQRHEGVCHERVGEADLRILPLVFVGGRFLHFVVGRCGARGRRTFRVTLLKPNRIPKGVLELANTKTGREYMTRY